jgi:anti-anti-sigma factor
MRLSVDRFVEGDAVRVALRGEVDASTRELLIAALDAAIGTAGAASVVVDLTDLRFMDCFGLSALIRGRQVADAHGVGYTIAHPSGTPLLVLAITGVLDYLANEPAV